MEADDITVFCLRMKYAEVINYTYLIRDNTNGDTILIDPSWELNKLTKFMTEEKMLLKAILLTHGHYDHLNLVDDILEETSVDVYCGEHETDIKKYLSAKVQPLKDGEILKIENIAIYCMHTPGHTLGSMCFYVNEKYIFTGDTLFIEGCGNPDLYENSAYDMFHSVQKIISFVKNDTLVYPGHAYKAFPGKSIDFLKKNNIYFNIYAQNDFIEFLTRPKNNYPFL